MQIAGLDIGTTGCKCTVFDEKGTFLGKSYRDYPVKRTVEKHEIDVSSIMNAVYTVISEMAEQYPDIAGIGITSFGETFVCTNSDGEPLYPAMLYTDPRGQEECQVLVQKLGERNIANITGLRPHEMYSLPKIMWLKKNHPEIYTSVSKIFLMEDYVVYHLTGKAQIDYSLASRTMAFDIRNLCWSEEIFEAAGIDMHLMSKPVPAGSIVGTVTDSISEKTGLSPDTKIISVGHDQVAAAVGAGAFDGTTAVDGAGTVECLTPVYDHLPDLDIMYQGYFSVVPYVISGKYIAYAFSYTGGALIQWCTQTLAKKEQEFARKSGISVNEYLETTYTARRGNETPGNLLILPHFAGAATPYMDTGSKGAVLGLTTDTTVADIYRGCMEGVAYEMNLNLHALQGSGIHFQKLHATGGGARSEQWMQMKADILNLPVVALKTMDAGTVGSAMLTGIALGIFSGLQEAADLMLEQVRTYEPRPQMHQKYQAVFQKYKQVYQAVRPLM